MKLGVRLRNYFLIKISYKLICYQFNLLQEIQSLLQDTVISYLGLREAGTGRWVRLEVMVGAIGEAFLLIGSSFVYFSVSRKSSGSEAPYFCSLTWYCGFHSRVHSFGHLCSASFFHMGLSMTPVSKRAIKSSVPPCLWCSSV